ncbi:hypothetical protein ACFU0Y_06380, partial [Kocuria sp. NPDC057446]
MSRHGRPHQPRFGDPDGEPARDGGVPGPAEGAAPETSPEDAPEASAEGAPGAPEGTAARRPPRAGSTASTGRTSSAGGPDSGLSTAPAADALAGGRVRVNDGTKVTPLADDDDLEEAAAAGGRFSAWRRHRQERAAARTLTASRLPPEHEPARAGST